MELTGAQIFVKSLEKEGVKYLFGIPGGAVIPIFDVLYESKIKFVLARHEQAAAHMADGYARSTGKVGVCIATSGPGATNLTTGIATAYMDSVPIVAFTGQVATHLVGNDAFQEADTTGITRPITKHNYLVKDIKDLSRIIKEAFYIASTGRPGPVLVDIPVDIQKSKCEFNSEEQINIRGYKPKYKGHPQQIKKAVDLILNAQRPLLYGGGGIVISEASKELREFIKLTSIPITLTLMGIGSVPSDYELFTGMVGMHGTFCSNYAMQNADLIIGVGVRFDDRVTGKIRAFSPKSKKIQIDIDPTSIDKTIGVDVPIVGDCKNVLSSINETIRKKTSLQQYKKRLQPWLKLIKQWKEKNPLSYKKDNQPRPGYIIEKISELTNGEAIISTEVGQNQMWAEQFYNYKYPRQLLTSGGLGTMGFGFPAAIGAQIANPDKVVFDIAGDGSFQMNIQELATISEYNIPVKVAILNNSFLGMVRQWQDMFYNKRFSGTYLGKGNPDFVKVASAYRIEGIRVEKKEDVELALKKAISVKKPFIIEFIIPPEEKVLPMVPAGAALDEVIIELA